MKNFKNVVFIGIVMAMSFATISCSSKSMKIIGYDDLQEIVLVQSVNEQEVGFIVENSCKKSLKKDLVCKYKEKQNQTVQTRFELQLEPGETCLVILPKNIIPEIEYLNIEGEGGNAIYHFHTDLSDWIKGEFKFSATSKKLYIK